MMNIHAVRARAALAYESSLIRNRSSSTILAHEDHVHVSIVLYAKA